MSFFAGTPRLIKVQSVVWPYEGEPNRCLMLYVKRAILSRHMRSTMCVELPRLDFSTSRRTCRRPCETGHVRDQRCFKIWQDVAKETMVAIGFQFSVLRPAACDHPELSLVVVVHVEDLLRAGTHLEWLYLSLKNAT